MKTNISVEELDGRINVIEDNKETFDLDLKEIEKSINELSKLKALLYEKNNKFKLNDGRSIQQAIVDNANLRKLKATYEQLLQLKNSKMRVTEVNNSLLFNENNKLVSNRLDRVIDILNEVCEIKEEEGPQIDKLYYELGLLSYEQNLNLE